MPLTFEIDTRDVRPFERLKVKYPKHVRSAENHAIEGTEWLTFMVDMTKVVAPHVFALLTVLIAKDRKVIVIQDGKRKKMTQAELKRLKKEHAGGGKASSRKS